jgi:hypothetical protein
MKKLFRKNTREGLPNGPNEIKTTESGFIISERGQWDFPGLPTAVPTPTGRITMQGVEKDLVGIDNFGNMQYMTPGNEYQFEGNMVYEIPMAQVGLQKEQGNPPIYSRENYLKDIEANINNLFKNGVYVTPYTSLTRPNEKNCINGICYLTRKLTNDAININYISNPDFEGDLNKNNFYRANLEDGFEIGDILQYYTNKGSTLSGFPGKVTPANSKDPWPQHAISIIGKRKDNKGKTWLKVVNNRGTDIAKIDEISEIDLMKRATEGYNHYDGILVNRYDPERVQEINRIKKENAAIFSGKNNYAKEYNNTQYTGAFKPKDIYGKNLPEAESSKEFRKVINSLYPTLGKSSNMPKEQFDILMNYLYGIGLQETDWGRSSAKTIKDNIPESAYPTLRDWLDSDKDDWKQDYWNKNANNVKNKYKNIEEFKEAISEKNVDPEVSTYLRLHSPKSKGIFQQKELSERGRYFNYGFNDTKSQIASAAALLIDNYHKVKKKFPDKSERELTQLAVLMHNAPSKALNPVYANYYPKNNSIDYFNKVEAGAAQPQEINSYKPLVKSQQISEKEKKDIVKFLNQFKRIGGNVYSDGGAFNPDTDEIIEFIDDLPKAQIGIQTMRPDATSVNMNLPQIDLSKKLKLTEENKKRIQELFPDKKQAFKELESLYYNAYEDFGSRFNKLNTWPELSGKTINLTTDRYRGANVPIEYLNMLTDSAKRFKLDPYLLYAIAGRESTFGQGKNNEGRNVSPINLVSGWNIDEPYRPYSYERFLADKNSPNIIKSKSSMGLFFHTPEKENELNELNNYIIENNLFDEYKNKISKSPKLQYTNPFDLVSEFIVNKGIEKYNPGDPDYKNKINKEIELLRSDPEFTKYYNTMNKKFGGLVKAQEGKQVKLRRRNQSAEDDVLLGPTLQPFEVEDRYPVKYPGFGMPYASGRIEPTLGPVEAALFAPTGVSMLSNYVPRFGSALMTGLNQSLPGMSSVAGATYGNLLGSMAATDAITNRIPQIPGQLSRGEYEDAASNALMSGLDLYGANMISPLFKGTGRLSRNSQIPKQLPGSINTSRLPNDRSDRIIKEIFGDKIGTRNDLKLSNPNFKTWRDPDTGQIVYRLEKEDYRWDDDWETMAPRDFRDYVNYWINHNKNKYRFSGGYSEMPKINRDINEFMSMAQFGKRPLLTRDRIALTDRELMKLQDKSFEDPNFEYFDFRNDRIGSGMTYNGKDISQNRREFDIREAAKMAKNYTWAPWKNDVIAPEFELLNNKPYTGREAFQSINPNKYGGSIYKNGGTYNPNTDEIIGFID